MTMRSPARRSRAATIDPRAFAWDRALIATLRHVTLPWGESIEATPLADAGELGMRDRLSLVAQFAAHQALLHFAGFADAMFDDGDWAVVRKRGSDCRLVRTAARAGEDAPPALTVINDFAARIGAPPLESLRQPWGRAESVYIDADARLRDDAAADLRWMRAAAAGEIASPGADALREVLQGRARRYRGVDAADAIVAAAALGAEQVIRIGAAASPLQRYSAIAPLAALAGGIDERGESEIVERVVDAVARTPLLVIVTNRERFDGASSRVVDMLIAAGAGVWIGEEGDADLPPARCFVVAPTLAARHALESAGRERIDALVASDAFPAFLATGAVPFAADEPRLAAIREPQRSFLAAVALLGTRTPTEVVNAFLHQLAGSVTAEELVIDGLTLIDGGQFAFSSAHIRDAARQAIPQSSRPTLCRLAADVVVATSADLSSAAALLIDAGEPRAAAELLERIETRSHEDALAILALPRHALTPRLAETLASALADAGRYRDAREVAMLVGGDAREHLLARIERRTGDYAAALARLDRIGARTCLRAELLYLENRFDDMRAALDGCEKDNAPQAAYLRALLAHENGETFNANLPPGHYLASRLDTYRALAAGELDAAAAHARASLERARSLAEKIDAAMDRLFILFTAGSWDAARDEALHTLALVEETQGDRAAAGVLFMLAYLAADDGQWVHAEQRIERLRHFYRGRRDDRRLRELDLLTAHLDFSRGRFDDAAPRAQTIVSAADASPQMREAAALIVDECEWIAGRAAPLRSTGGSGNVELTRRHAAMRVRRDGGDATLREPRSGSETLKHFRDALGTGRLDDAQRLAAAMKIAMPKRQDGASPIELRFLSHAATREFPFGPHEFAPAAWRFASRNRLGQWNEIGSGAPAGNAELDRVLAAGGADWIVCSDRELLFVEGIDSWNAESRDGLAAIFRTRAEHHRMRRLLDQEETARTTTNTNVEGIVGDAASMRELFALIPRVARRDVPVCVLGESGTGKELVARAIHRHSPRRGRIFTAVNCAALPENLIESELFGAVRGAFTGADRDRAGLIETTDGGTLFLDEIGEMPLAAQAKLLRFLQEGEFRRVGDTQNRTADVRVVSATNRKLESAVEEGRFREDLYYRIGGIEILLPPLRDRTTDIPLLAAHFLAKEREKSRGGPSKLTADAESAFLAYRWPGNVRELQNTIRAAHALAGDAAAIDLEHLPERMRSAVVRGGPAVSSYQDAVARFRRELIEKSLVEAKGNQNRAATMLNMSRQALAYQIRELGILVRANVTDR